jgi:hypothetical protein
MGNNGGRLNLAHTISRIKKIAQKKGLFIVETIFIPRINDEPQDFATLFRIWNRVHDMKESELDFSLCDFLKQNAVAFLGGMIADIKSHGGLISINTDSLSPAIKANLEQNGFLYTMGDSALPWDGNSIPYREDHVNDSDAISVYLQEKWIGKGWINIEPRLAYEIVGNVLEIYTNAFTHSGSSTGVFSCGQHYPTLETLKITVVDFGIGIPRSVRDYLMNRGEPYQISDEGALQMAFQEGFSTKSDLGGMGLKLLKEFIQKNRGRLDIYSHSGHAIVDASGERYEKVDAFFKGTVVNITLKRDQKFYYLREEKLEQPYF